MLLQLFDRDDNPYRGRLLYLTMERVGTALSVRSDMDGRILLQGIPSGYYTLSDRPDAPRNRTYGFSVSSGKQVNHRIIMR